jgi:putative transcriptional regulator
MLGLRAVLLGLLIVLALRPAANAADGEQTLAGQLLIAAPSIADPRFYHTVILIVRHDKNGAFGIVINRPLGWRPVAELLAATGEDAPTAAGKLQVFAGGPVQPELGFVVHSADYRGEGTTIIDRHVAVTANRQALRDIGEGRGPAKAFFAFGYAGWAAGQLEAELERKDWFTAPEEPRLIFDESREQLWDEAMARRTRDL